MWSLYAHAALGLAPEWGLIDQRGDYFRREGPEVAQEVGGLPPLKLKSPVETCAQNAVWPIRRGTPGRRCRHVQIVGGLPREAAGDTEIVEEAVKASARTPGLEKRLYRGGKTQEDLKIPPKPQESQRRAATLVVKTIQIQRQPAPDENTYIVWWGHYAIQTIDKWKLISRFHKIVVQLDENICGLIRSLIQSQYIDNLAKKIDRVKTAHLEIQTLLRGCQNSATVARQDSPSHGDVA